MNNRKWKERPTPRPRRPCRFYITIALVLFFLFGTAHATTVVLNTADYSSLSASELLHSTLTVEAKFCGSTGGATWTLTVDGQNYSMPGGGGCAAFAAPGMPAPMPPGTHTFSVSGTGQTSQTCALDGFTGLCNDSGGCTNLKTFLQDLHSGTICLNPGDSVTGTIVVPDKGQTSQIQPYSGNGQTGLVSTVSSGPIVARVTGSGGTPKSGISVDFSATSHPAGGSSGTVATANATTDANGLASTSFTFGDSSGSYQFQAACANASDCGLQSSVGFSEIAKTSAQVTALTSVICGWHGIASPGYAGQIAVAAINQLTGKPVKNLSIDFAFLSLPGGSGYSLAPSNATTDKYGIAWTSLTLGSQQGSYVISATCASCQVQQEVDCTVTAAAPLDALPLAPEVSVLKRTDIGFSVSASPTEVEPLDENYYADSSNLSQISIQGPPNTGFNAYVLPIPNSGGHQHTNDNRPTGVVSPTSSFTDAHGLASITYTAGNVGGMERVLVSTQNGSGDDSILTGDAFITVSISPHLERLERNPLYVITGNSQNHPVARYGAPVLLSQIPKLASLYASSSTSGGGILSINDMSLANGGLIDIRNGNWQSPHLCHRTGTSVDLDRARIVNGKRQPLPNFANAMELFIQWAGQSNPDNAIDCLRVVESTKTVTGKTVCYLHLECPAREWHSCPQAVDTCREN